MTYIPVNPNGQATMANSAPVVIASNQTAVPTDSFELDVTGLSAATLNADFLPATDANGYRALFLQVNGTFVGTLSFQNSSDNVNWAAMQAYWISTDSITIATGSTGQFEIPIRSRYIRVRMTTYTSGTATGVARFSSLTVNPRNSNAISQAGVWTVQPGNTANTTPWLWRHAAATTSAGLLIAKVQAAASTNATITKASTAAIYGWHLTNNATTTRYVRFFNKATAPTLGTDSPAFVIPISASSTTVTPPATMNFALATGFAYAITAAAPDLDATATTANDVIGSIWYV